MNTEQQAYVSWTTKTIRRAATFVTAPGFRSETPQTPSEGWQRAEELNKLGYGIIIAYEHFGLGDPPRVMARIMRSPVLGERPILMPEAMHQHLPFFDPLGRSFAVRPYPLATGETIARAKRNAKLAKKLAKRFGVDITDRVSLKESGNQYEKAAVAHLGAGGVEAIAPQGTRQGSYLRKTTAIETILKEAAEQGIHNIAVIFIGYRLDGVADYGKARGYNLGKKYKFQDGKCRTIDELMEEATVNGEIRKLPQVIENYMIETYPPEYLSKPQEQTQPTDNVIFEKNQSTPSSL